MKLATWNVNSLTVRLPQVLAWLQAHAVDVLALQELKLTDDKFPHDAFAALGYQSVCFGQKTYNGVALISRHPLQRAIKNNPHFEDDQARLLTATLATSSGDVRIINGYFVNGHAPDSEKFQYKMKWLTALQNHVQQELKQHTRLVLLGDFNITFDDADSWDPVGLHETIHHTTHERQHLQALLALGLTDGHRHCHPLLAPAQTLEKKDKHFSWWDYRDFGFRRQCGLRIDHILISQDLVPCLKTCDIDKAQRQTERPSDHAPVVMALDIPL